MPGLYDILAFTHAALDGSAELNLGLLELRRRLPSARRWYWASPGSAPSPAAFPDWSDAPFVMVLLNPALLISDNLEQELLAAVSAGDGFCCALPGDLRSLPPGVLPDYASRPGFDRFVARLATVPRIGIYDGNPPWLCLIAREALVGLGNSAVSWEDLPALLGVCTAVAQHAFVHSYADYYLNDRAEMLRLLPDTVHTLLDIGGGAGNFGRLFMEQRGGEATLLEQNLVMAASARTRGLKVLEGDFRDLVLHERYDCISFLEVLEHLADPFAALLKARQGLKSGGYLLLSVPNMGHWSVVWDLLEGRFDYIPVGILCTTHLRFFTRSGLEKLLADTGFVIERWENSVSPLPEPFAAFLAQRSTPLITPDHASLATDCFHVLARSTC